MYPFPACPPGEGALLEGALLEGAVLEGALLLPVPEAELDALGVAYGDVTEKGPKLHSASACHVGASWTCRVDGSLQDGPPPGGYPPRGGPHNRRG